MTVEFVKLVSKMRTQQRIYFKTRLKGALIASKELEKQVDAEIEQIEKGGLL